MEIKRLKLWQLLKTNGNTDKDYDTFIKSYFTNQKGVKNLYNWLIKTTDPSTKTDENENGDYYYNNTINEFYSKFICDDLPWAKSTTFCGGSGGGNAKTYSWDNFPCVVELAKTKNISKESNNSYVIGDFRYFPNGRKGIISTGKVENFTCNDSEFKTSNTGGGQSGGGQTGNAEYQPVEKGAKTWKGDPYQYKVVDGQWFAKSWKNRGKIIPKWVSLANNKTATGILDGRFPGVRVSKQSAEKSGEYAKGFSDMRKNAESLSKQGIQLPQTDYKKFMTSPTTNTGEGGTQTVTAGTETNTKPEGITQPTTKHNPASADF